MPQTNSLSPTAERQMTELAVDHRTKKYLGVGYPLVEGSKSGSHAGASFGR
jgi:hypothetical protein